MEHLFEYISGNLSKVTFEVYAAEDIHAADGVSEDYFKADELVGKIVTGDNGIAQMENLPAGRYYVKEVETAHGFVLDKEPRYVDLSYRDQDTPVITFQEEWQNRRQKVQVSILKKEKDGERVLAGAVFGLYTRDDIKNKDGNVLMEAESLIEQKTTDEKGQIVFRADLPVDGRYYVKNFLPQRDLWQQRKNRILLLHMQEPDRKRSAMNLRLRMSRPQWSLQRRTLLQEKSFQGHIFV